jgi:integrase
MKGHIRPRGKRSWELKFDAGREPASGERKIQYVSFRGTKRQAQVKLAELIAAVGKGSYVEPSKATVADFVRARVDHWEAAGAITARTAQRYRQLVEHQIVPHLGAKSLQKLTRLDVEGWHTALRSGISARTIGHAHRVLSKAVGEAESDGMVSKNVCKLQRAPKVIDDEMVIVQDVPALLAALKGWRYETVAVVSLFTGMRLGEVLALRWNRIDLDGKVLKVREAIEQTKAHGIRFKASKTRAGQRDITLPEPLVEVFRERRKAAMELRVQLGTGKLPDDALVFADIDSKPMRPNTISPAWASFAESIGMPDVTFHALRHTHASQLIDAGVDVVTISKRLGHAKPDITLRIYAHLFKKDDSKAAAAINAMWNR